VCDIVVKRFTFAVSSPDERLFYLSLKIHEIYNSILWMNELNEALRCLQYVYLFTSNCLRNVINMAVRVSEATREALLEVVMSFRL